MRVILDGTVLRVRLDREAISISLLIAGARADALRRRAGGFRAASIYPAVLRYVSLVRS